MYGISGKNDLMVGRVEKMEIIDNLDEFVCVCVFDLYLWFECIVPGGLFNSVFDLQMREENQGLIWKDGNI